MSHESKHENYVFGGFLGFFDHFWGPGDATRVFPKKIFYSAQLHMKIQLAAKFEKNLMDGYLTLVRTHTRTHTRTDARTPLKTIVPLR